MVTPAPATGVPPFPFAFISPSLSPFPPVLLHFPGLPLPSLSLSYYFSPSHLPPIIPFALITLLLLHCPLFHPQFVPFFSTSPTSRSLSPPFLPHPSPSSPSPSPTPLYRSPNPHPLPLSHFSFLRPTSQYNRVLCVSEAVLLSTSYTLFLIHYHRDAKDKII